MAVQHQQGGSAEPDSQAEKKQRKESILETNVGEMTNNSSGHDSKIAGHRMN